MNISIDSKYSKFCEVDIGVSNNVESGVFWSRDNILKSKIEFGFIDEDSVKSNILMGCGLMRYVLDSIGDGKSNDDIIGSVIHNVKGVVNDISYGSGGNNLGEIDVVVDGHEKTVFVTPKDVADVMSSALNVVSSISDDSFIGRIKKDALNYSVNSQRIGVLKQEAKDIAKRVRREYADELRVKVESLSEKIDNDKVKEVVQGFEDGTETSFRFKRLDFSDGVYNKNGGSKDKSHKDRFSRDSVFVCPKMEDLRVFSLLTGSQRRKYYVERFRSNQTSELPEYISKADAFKLIEGAEVDGSKLVRVFDELKANNASDNYEHIYIPTDLWSVYSFADAKDVIETMERMNVVHKSLAYEKVVTGGAKSMNIMSKKVDNKDTLNEGQKKPRNVKSTGIKPKM